MSQTNQRQLKKLLRAAQKPLNVRNESDLWPRLLAYKNAIKDRLGPGASNLMVTPYRDGCWMIYWIGGDLRENARPVNPVDFSLSPEMFANKYLAGL